MSLFFHGLQAGNRSGTGTYTRQLLAALWDLAPGLDAFAAWPPDEPLPGGPLERYLLRRAGGAGRVWYEQWGYRADYRRVGARAVHYPASVGALRPVGPMIVTVHDLAFLHHPEWFPRSRALYLRQAVACSVRAAARVIADSQATARDLDAHLGVKSAAVAHLGVSPHFAPQPPQRIAAARARYCLPERYFLYVGTIEPRKNLARLVRAWSAVTRDAGVDLVVAGRDGWRSGAFHAEVAATSHRGRIHQPGFIEAEDLPAILSGATAFVWPSLWEGFGLPPLEAMACGVPVLTSNVSSLPEVVGDAAMTVDPEDEAAMAEGLLTLATDADLRARIAAAGLERAAAFTWRRTAEAVLAVYRDVLGPDWGAAQ